MQSAAAGDWTIVPSVRAGPITSSTTEEELVRLYGADNVVETVIQSGMIEPEPVMVIFPDQPKKTAVIHWRYSPKGKVPAMIEIDNEGSLWKTAEGITVGTSLQTIQRINGKPVVLTGFGWEYAGTIIHANGGRLKALGQVAHDKSIRHRSLTLRVAPRAESLSSSDDGQLLGEREFLSDHPAMTRAQPQVYEMLIVFPLE